MKKSWNFALVEIWSSCRCDMKIIFGAFDKVDVRLLSSKTFSSSYGLQIFVESFEIENCEKNCEKRKDDTSLPL